MDVIDVLRLLTHDENVPYMDYVKKIKDSGNPHAVKVKAADLAHNSDLTRLNRIDDKDLKELKNTKQP
jgi:hypothetical protein